MINETILPETTGWLLLALFSVAWILLGRYWGKKASGLDGYMLAGRSVGLALGTATAVATWVTSNTTMLAPQFALEFGIWGMLAYSTASFGLFLFAPMAQRIRQLMPRGYTSGEFVRLRYGRAAYLLFLAISLFYALTWMISMAMAGGTLLEALSGIRYEFGMTVVLGVCVMYTLFGGLYAVIGTDFIQSFIILVGVVVVAIATLTQVDLSQVHAHTQAARPALMHVLFPAAIMAVFNNLLFGLGEIFHSNVWWSRAFAMREGIGKKAYMLGGLLWLPIPVAAGFIALAAPLLDVNIVRPDMVGPVVAGKLLGFAGAIVVFVVVFSSIASSIDSLLAATADLITKDVIQQFIMPKANDAKLEKISSWVIAGLGVVTWLVCLPRIGTLATVLFFAGALVASTIWPIAMGLYSKKTNPTGAALGMLLGSLGGLCAYFLVAWYVAALVGTVISMTCVLVSTWIAPHSFDWADLNPEISSDTESEEANLAPQPAGGAE